MRPSTVSASSRITFFFFACANAVEARSTASARVRVLIGPQPPPARLRTRRLRWNPSTMQFAFWVTSSCVQSFVVVSELTRRLLRSGSRGPLIVRQLGGRLGLARVLLRVGVFLGLGLGVGIGLLLLFGGGLLGVGVGLLFRLR